MKTSNKLLLAFLLVIFLVPVLVLMSFQRMIRNGEFTALTNQPGMNGPYQDAPLKPFRVVSVRATGDVRFSCYFEYSEKMTYSYDLGEDSIRIYSQGDTLFVTCVASAERNKIPGQYRPEMAARLNIPSIGRLIIENAGAVILSGDTAQAAVLAVDLSRNSLLRIGATDDEHRREEPIGVRQRLGKVTINSMNSEIQLGKTVDIGQLDVSVQGMGAISIDKGAVIENMHTLSDSVSVKGDWNYLKKLMPPAN